MEIRARYAFTNLRQLPWCRAAYVALDALAVCRWLRCVQDRHPVHFVHLGFPSPFATRQQAIDDPRTAVGAQASRACIQGKPDFMLTVRLSVLASAAHRQSWNTTALAEGTCPN